MESTEKRSLRAVAAYSSGARRDARRRVISQPLRRAVFKLIERAEECTDLNSSMHTFRQNHFGRLQGGLTQTKRSILAKAARSKKNSWFKSVSWMGGVADDIVRLTQKPMKVFGK